MALRISLIHWGNFGQGHKPFLWVCRQHEDPQLQAAVTREFKDATANRVNCKCLEANPTIWSFDKGQLRQRRTVRGVSSGLPAARTRATRGFGMVGAKKYFSNGLKPPTRATIWENIFGTFSESIKRQANTSFPKVRRALDFQMWPFLHALSGIRRRISSWTKTDGKRHGRSSEHKTCLYRLYIKG